MTLAEGTREVTGEMIKIQQLLRHTSPAHKFSEEEKKQILEGVERAERTLGNLAGEVRSH